MSQRLRIRDAQIFRLAIPMRLRFEHAAATRDVADPVILALSGSAPYAQFIGCGETLARQYVTGESAETVVADLRDFFIPLVADFKPDSFAAALEFIEALPFQLDGRIVTAARCAFELALLDLAGRAFGRRPSDAAGWLGLPGFGPPGCVETARYSGIVVGSSRFKMKALLRAQRWYGLRDFKLKVGTPNWEEKLNWAAKFLRPAIGRGDVTLRADANGAWSLDEAHDAVEKLEQAGVCAIEQPFADANDADLAWLSEQSKCEIVADESLITADDAKRLIAGQGVRVFNIRLAKNGGLLPSLRIARAALTAGIDVQLGCLVGETSILTAAGVAFLECVPKVRFVEGAFGTFMLRGDVVRRSLRFGYGGKLRTPTGAGLGIDVDFAALQRYAVEKPRVVHL